MVERWSVAAKGYALCSLAEPECSVEVLPVAGIVGVDINDRAAISLFRTRLFGYPSECAADRYSLLEQLLLRMFGGFAAGWGMACR